MSRVNEMIRALRKCAEQHEREEVYTGQIVTSLLCRDVADHLEKTKWHYPSKGEYPTEKELVLMKIPGCYVLGWYDDGNWFIDDGETLILQRFISRWQYIEPPKEEA